MAEPTLARAGASTEPSLATEGAVERHATRDQRSTSCRVGSPALKLPPTAVTKVGCLKRSETSTAARAQMPATPARAADDVRGLDCTRAKTSDDSRRLDASSFRPNLSSSGRSSRTAATDEDEATAAAPPKVTLSARTAARRARSTAEGGSRMSTRARTARSSDEWFCIANANGVWPSSFMAALSAPFVSSSVAISLAFSLA
jgi:hypothetical protein